MNEVRTVGRVTDKRLSWIETVRASWIHLRRAGRPPSRGPRELVHMPVQMLRNRRDYIVRWSVRDPRGTARRGLASCLRGHRAPSNVEDPDFEDEAQHHYILAPRGFRTRA